MYDCRNKYDYSFRLNTSYILSDEAGWTSSDRLLLSRGPALGNERSPTVTDKSWRVYRRQEVDDRSRLLYILSVVTSVVKLSENPWPRECLAASRNISGFLDTTWHLSFCCASFCSYWRLHVCFCRL